MIAQLQDELKTAEATIASLRAGASPSETPPALAVGPALSQPSQNLLQWLSNEYTMTDSPFSTLRTFAQAFLRAGVLPARCALADFPLDDILNRRISVKSMVVASALSLGARQLGALSAAKELAGHAREAAAHFFDKPSFDSAIGFSFLGNFFLGQGQPESAAMMTAVARQMFARLAHQDSAQTRSLALTFGSANDKSLLYSDLLIYEAEMAADVESQESLAGEALRGLRTAVGSLAYVSASFIRLRARLFKYLLAQNFPELMAQLPHHLREIAEVEAAFRVYSAEAYAGDSLKESYIARVDVLFGGIRALHFLITGMAPQALEQAEAILDAICMVDPSCWMISHMVCLDLSYRIFSGHGSPKARLALDFLQRLTAVLPASQTVIERTFGNSQNVASNLTKAFAFEPLEQILTSIKAGAEAAGGSPGGPGGPAMGRPAFPPGPFPGTQLPGLPPFGSLPLGMPNPFPGGLPTGFPPGGLPPGFPPPGADFPFPFPPDLGAIMSSLGAGGGEFNLASLLGGAGLHPPPAGFLSGDSIPPHLAAFLPPGGLPPLPAHATIEELPTTPLSGPLMDGSGLALPLSDSSDSPSDSATFDPTLPYEPLLL